MRPVMASVAAPAVELCITTNDGEDLVTAEPVLTLEGKAPVDATTLLVLEDGVVDLVHFDHVHHFVLGHAFDAAGDGHLDGVGADFVRSSGNGLEPGGTEAVDGTGRGVCRVAGHQGGHSHLGDAGAHLEHVADDDVVNVLGVHSGLDIVQ